jgi:hypothetical protein
MWLSKRGFNPFLLTLNANIPQFKGLFSIFKSIILKSSSKNRRWVTYKLIESSY